MNKFYVVHRDKSTNLITKANVYTQWAQDVLIKRLHNFNDQHKEQFAELVDNKDICDLIDLLEAERIKVKRQLAYADIITSIDEASESINTAIDKMDELREELEVFKENQK